MESPQLEAEEVDDFIAGLTLGRGRRELGALLADFELLVTDFVDKGIALFVHPLHHLVDHFNDRAAIALQDLHATLHSTLQLRAGQQCVERRALAMW